MRILQICQRPQRRGAEVFAWQLSQELTRRGHEVATVYLYPHDGEGRLPRGPRDLYLDGDEDHPLETLIGFHPTLLQRLKSVMESFQPDITQVNGARTVKYGILSRRLAGAPTGSIVYRNIGAPGDWIQGVRRRLFYRLILENVDGVVAISRGLLEDLRPAFPKRTPVTVISNAVDPDTLRPTVGRPELRASTGTPSGVPVALFLGSLTPEKRVDRLIDAVREVRAGGLELHLWIVGEGPLRNALEDRVERLGLEPVVQFFGSRKDVASYIEAADLLALVSDTEGVPAVVLEAGLLGRPVVATRVGGVPECVRDEVTGLLVEPEDFAALVGALTRVAGSADLRERLGCRARTRVADRHSIEHIGSKFLSFYRSVRTTTPGSDGRPSTGNGSTPKLASYAASRFSEEMRFLALAARPKLDPASKGALAHLLSEEVDWELLLTLAERHKLLPLLVSHLQAFPKKIPPVVERVLENAEFANGCWILECTGQLVNVLAALEDRGIVAVPYKGPALAAQLYGSGVMRPAGDLDLVVRPRDVPEARRALVALGYGSRVPRDDPAWTEFMIRNRYHERFEREDGVRVELHWGFSNRDFPFALDLDEVFSRLVPVRVGGHQVPAFRSDDLLLILSVHGAKHRWDRLEWLAGVAELIRSADDIDWEGLLSRASSLGVRRTLFLALELAHDLLDAPLPETVLRRVRSDRRVPSLADEVVDFLCRDPAGWDVPELLQRDRFRIRLRERWRDRVRFVWHRATTPSDPERWDVTRLGPWLVPLHAFRRPLHVTSQLMIGLRALLPGSA